MKIVFNASPLITLARIGQLDALRSLFGVVHVSYEVYHEVVVAGSGMPGASAVAAANWIQVTAVVDTDEVARATGASGLGVGEVTAVILAKELNADLVLMDEWKGRRLAAAAGLAVVGCVGILEALHRRGELKDLRGAYEELLRQGIRIELRTLQNSLRHFEIAPL